jgi:hypothetical protein
MWYTPLNYITSFLVFPFPAFTGSGNYEIVTSANTYAQVCKISLGYIGQNFSNCTAVHFIKVEEIVHESG